MINLIKIKKLRKFFYQDFRKYTLVLLYLFVKLARALGFEPRSTVLETGILPLDDARSLILNLKSFPESSLPGKLYYTK